MHFSEECLSKFIEQGATIATSLLYKVLPDGDYKQLMKLLHLHRFENFLKTRDVNDDNAFDDANQVYM